MTPSELLELHSNQTYSLTEKMNRSGYNSHSEYFDVIQRIKKWNEMDEICKDTGGAIYIQTMLKYVKMSLGYKDRNDTVVYYPLEDKSEIYFAEELIAVIDKKNKQVILPVVEKRRAVKERLNRILMRFCGCKLFSRNGEWFIVRPYEEDEKIEGEMVIPGLPDHP